MGFGKLPLRLEDNIILDANGKRVCALFNWYEDGDVEKHIPDDEVRSVGEWIVETLNATELQNDKDSDRNPLETTTQWIRPCDAKRRRVSGSALTD